jgi:lipopolysaccharide/colanic/teichoic acid biosynthesis glycosyltransferase
MTTQTIRSTASKTTPIKKRRANWQRWWGNAAKRAFDVLLSALGLLILSPVFLFIAILIKRGSPGPVFFRGPRMGRGERVFQILKFRTMREEPASYNGPGVTGRDDPRITPEGRWLRATKMNELPQLWNVLAGEMSLVGPRPEDPKIAATWSPEVRREILSVRPGITSPSSVAYHDEEDRLTAAGVMDEYIRNILPDKLRLDQLYVRHHNFITDLDALFWTFVILIPRLGEHRISEGWLFGGPISRFVRNHMSWMAIDFLVAFGSIGLVGVLWRLGGPLDIGLWKSINVAVLLAFLFGLFNTALGLRVVAWSHAGAEDVLRLFVSCALVTVTVIGSQFFLLPEAYLPVRFMINAGLLVLIGFVAVRYRLRLMTGLANRWITLRRSGYGAGERVLIVGAGEGGEFAAWLLRRPDFRRLYSIVGFADDDPAKQGMRFDGIQVLGTTADIPDLVGEHDVGVIFYAISKISSADSERILAVCKSTGLHLVIISDVLFSLHSHLTKELPRFEMASPGPLLTRIPAPAQKVESDHP